MRYLILIIYVMIASAVMANVVPNEGPNEVTPREAEKHLDLDEVVVTKRTKDKYRKKGNPAVEFIERVMANRHMTDPRRNNPYYQYGQYERINVGLLDFKIDSAGALGFLTPYLDESPLSGGQVLNLTVKEKVSDVYYRRDPETRREVVKLRNRHGLDDLVADAASMQTIADDVLSPVDLYDTDNIYLIHGNYVSPLGNIATDFYKFYLSDTIADAERGDSLIVVSFLPHNPAMTGFNGRLYVVKGDSATFIRRAEMRLPKAANVNYVRDLLIIQEYDRAPDGSRLKTRDELLIELSALGQKAFASRLTVTNSHNFEPPRDSTILESEEKVIERHDLESRIASYRPLDAQHGESNMEQMIADLQRKKWFRYTFNVMRTLVDDRIKIVGKQAPVAYGPIFSTISRNDLEGWRLRGGLETTAYMSPHWFLKGYGAYGFGDHRWKYGASVEYSINRKKEHAMEFPIRSLKLSHTYDVDHLGQAYSDGDAFFNSLTASGNGLLTYRRDSELQFTWETYQRVAFKLALSHQRQEATRTVRFIDGFDRQISHYQNAFATAEIRWAPGEKYYQSSKSRKNISMYGPKFRVTHTYSPKNLFGARHEVNKTEVGFEKRFWLSAWGHIDLLTDAGHVWSTSDFTSLLIPSANISYIHQKNSFALMKAMEFINDSYVDIHMEYQAKGALLNYIPLIKKLRLREVISFHSVWGNLSAKNDPARNPELLRFPDGAATRKMGKMPYMELQVGIENIFSFFRVDYIRRLTYTEGARLNGVQFSFHFTF